MNLGKHLLKIIVFCLCLYAPETFAQKDKSLQSTSIGTTGSRDSSHSLFAGGGYGSNMIYLGSTISQDQPYGYGSVSYGYKNKLYATVSAVHLSGVDPFMAFYIGSLNYSQVINNWFDISAGVYRYQVDQSLTDTLFSSFTYGDLTLGFDWKLLYSKISAGGLFAEENQAYFQLRNSRYFQTPEFFKGKVNISLDPYANLLFGTVTEVVTSNDTEYYYSVSSHSNKWKKKGQTTVPNTTYTDRFGLLEIDFGLSVALNTDFMTIEAEPSYVIPLYDDKFYPGTKGFIFQLSIFFRIF